MVKQELFPEIPADVQDRVDADNFLKTICDALEHCGAIDNDKRITDLHMHRRMDAVDPRTVIIVRTDQEQMFA